MLIHRHRRRCSGTRRQVAWLVPYEAGRIESSRRRRSRNSSDAELGLRRACVLPSQMARPGEENSSGYNIFPTLSLVLCSETRVDAATRGGEGRRSTGFSPARQRARGSGVPGHQTAQYACVIANVPTASALQGDLGPRPTTSLFHTPCR